MSDAYSSQSRMDLSALAPSANECFCTGRETIGSVLANHRAAEEAVSGTRPAPLAISHRLLRSEKPFHGDVCGSASVEVFECLDDDRHRCGFVFRFKTVGTDGFMSPVGYSLHRGGVDVHFMGWDEGIAAMSALSNAMDGMFAAGEAARRRSGSAPPSSSPPAGEVSPPQD